MFGGVNHHHAVLVEQAGVAFDQHSQVRTVLERQPGTAIRQHIGARTRCNIERRAHAATTSLVLGEPRAVYTGGFPVTQFGGVGAALVATRDKIGVGRMEFYKRFHDVLALDPGRIGGRANQHKVVVHDRKTLDGKTFGHDFFFSHLVMHKQHVGIAASAHVDGLPGAYRHNLDVDTAGLLEGRQQRTEQAGLFG